MWWLGKAVGKRGSKAAKSGGRLFLPTLRKIRKTYINEIVKLF
jgi:hypothetical protein